MNNYRLGTSLDIQVNFYKKGNAAGSTAVGNVPADITGYTREVYYNTSKGVVYVPESDLSVSGNCISWVYSASSQQLTGVYTIVIELKQGDGSTLLKAQLEGFSLIHPNYCSDPCAQTSISRSAFVELYEFHPVVPEMSDSKETWIVDGVDTGKPTRGRGWFCGTQVSAGALTLSDSYRNILNAYGSVFKVGDIYYNSSSNDVFRCSAATLSGTTATSTWVKVANIKGAAFTYDDFTEDEIAELKKPATDAATAFGILSAAWTVAEQGRVSAESARASAESGRVSAESARVSAESGRASAETSRVNAESSRVSAESGRSSAESSRASAESSRASAESARVSAENARVSAESSRATAESGRASAFTAAQQDRSQRFEEAFGMMCVEGDTVIDSDELPNLPYVEYAAQVLTDSQKTQARTNIGAAAASDVTSISSKMGDLSDLETTDKSSLVNAINEARQSGGGGVADDKPYLNLLDALACTENYAFSGKNDGVTRENSGWSLTDYILLKANTTYYGFGFYFENFYCFYDSSKNIVATPDVTLNFESSNKYKGTIEVGASDVYFRSSWLRSKTNPYISQYMDNYEPFGTYDYSFVSPKHTSEIDALTESVNKLNVPSLNLLDTSKATADTAFSGKNNGTTRASNGWSLTDYILLKANTTYYGFGFYFDNFYCFYDSSKNVVATPSVTITFDTSDKYTGKIVVGANDLYFRGSWLRSKANPYLSQYVGTYKSLTDVDFSYASPYLLKCHTLIGKNVLVIGDSISAYNYGNYDKWVQVLQKEGFIGNDVKNSSIHATGFVTDGTYAGGSRTGDNFVTRLQAITNPSSFDYVVVFGGVNDYIQGVAFDEFTTALETFFTYLATNFVNASIMVVTPLYRAIHSANAVGKTEDDYINAIKSIANVYHLPILNAHEDSGFYPDVDAFKTANTNSADGLHPNANWSRTRLAPYIRAFIERHLKY